MASPCRALARTVKANPMREPSDPYDSDEFRWWHLSRPSPELLDALAQGWMSPPGPVVDLGCGLGVEAGYLADLGFFAIGIDSSTSAIRRAGRRSSQARFLQADVRHLPFRTESLRFLLDRGCFHYLSPEDRPAYEQEARRVLVSGGRLLLRTCLRAAGVRNDIDEEVVRRTFAGWRLAPIDHGWIPSDTRMMETLIAHLEVE
jgi:SAM-dependent methyltransferase